MNIIQRFYLASIRKKLARSFKPLGLKRRDLYFVSVPHKIKDFLRTLPFLAGLRRSGNVMLFLPETYAPVVRLFKPNLFNAVYWTKIPQVLTREFDSLKKMLENYHFNWLIELNPEANLALPSLVEVERRVTYYNPKYFPYYNILIKGGFEVLMSFFNILNVDSGKLFKFSKLELKDIAKSIPGIRPVVFVNITDRHKFVKPEGTEWSGSIVFCEKEKTPVDEAIKKLFLCDSYYGVDDEFCEFARIFNKPIIES